MKYTNRIFLFPLLLLFILSGCSKDEIHDYEKYENGLSFPYDSDAHPKHESYQAIVDQYIPKGILGTSIMIKDEAGIWLGAGGSADLASNVAMQPGHQFLIASISKMYTATAIFSLVDDGVLSIDDPVSKWIDQSITDKVDNANEANISHLLAHTSGIHDFYTIAFEMDRFNRTYNDWDASEILEYVYGKNAYFEVGQNYAYSNTNYLLLGLILESATNKSLKEVYQEHIFDPLQVKNTFFDVRNNSTPATLVKGYYGLYGGGYVESQFLYKDELGTGDGGIATTAQDLGMFIDQLMNGNIVSQSSLDKMQDWFDIGEGGKNGFGIEYFTNDYGISYGHTGGVDGYASLANYYPDRNITIIKLFNYLPNSQSSFEATVDFMDAIDRAVLE